VSLLVAVMVAGAFYAGTRHAPRPVAPVASQVMRAQCQINTSDVQATVERLRDAVNQRRHGEISPIRFERIVADGIPKVAKAVRQQGVKCTPLRP